MAFTWEESPIGTGDTQCKRCEQLNFRGSGCQNCRETAKADSKLSPSNGKERPTPQDLPEWWLAIPRGTRGYGSPKGAAEGQDFRTLVPPGLYKLGTRQREFNGYKSRIEIPDRYNAFVWISESPEAGVYRRKRYADAQEIMDKLGE